MTCIIHINGWPGSGKRTIGQFVAKTLGGRLVDNHAMLNPAEALLERDDPRHQALWDGVRRLTLTYAVGLDPATPVVLPIPSRTIRPTPLCSASSKSWRADAAFP